MWKHLMDPDLIASGKSTNLLEKFIFRLNSKLAVLYRIQDKTDKGRFESFSCIPGLKCKV